MSTCCTSSGRRAASLFGARARNFNRPTRTSMSTIITTSTTSTSTSTPARLLPYQRSYTISTLASSSHKQQPHLRHPSKPTPLARSQSTNSHEHEHKHTNVFTSPFWSLDHCAHCYPEGPELSTRNVHAHAHVNVDVKAEEEELKRISEETIRSTKFNSSTTTGIQPTGSYPLSPPHLHAHIPIQPTYHVNMSTSAPTSSTSPQPSTPTPTSTTTTTSKPTVKPTPKPGQGILVPASKVHTTVKSELLQTLSSAEFNPDLVVVPEENKSGGNEVKREEGRRGRGVKLVGILATGMEDAANYAEFTKKSCESLGINYELRRVGAARQDQGDQPGVEIGVEEAILEANEEDGVDGIMVYYPIHGGSRDQYLQQCVSPLKDVEGLHHQFLFNLYHNIRHISPSTLRPIPASHLPTSTVNTNATEDPAPPGTVKSILPCTPLAIVKVLEFVGVYNKLLEWGDRARGKVITVINRSEVVGRPLAALLANDGARVLSVDIDSIVEFSKRPISSTAHTSKYNPHHIMTPLPSDFTLQSALAVSDVVISAVPSKNYKVKTEWLKDGCICVNVAGDKNFEADVRDKASIYVPSVGQMTIAMLQRNLLRLRKYRNMVDQPNESAF